MNIKCIELGEIAANCYLVSSKSAAVVIDPGSYSAQVREFLDSNRDKERLILITHGHFDHIAGAERLRTETGVKIAIGELDAPSLNNPLLNLSRQFGIDLAPFEADKTFCDGEEFQVGDLEFKTILTPGHTVGGVCYLLEDVLFSGDVLFQSSVGRTDFPGGNTAQLLRSIKKLLELDGKTRLLSGHGGESTLYTERRYNPYIRGIV